MSVFDRINGIESFSKLLKKNHLKKNKYLVVSDRLLYSSLKYSLRNEDLIILTPHNPNNKIKSQFQITNPLNQNFNNNFIFIGEIEDLNYLKNKYRIYNIKSTNVLFTKKNIKINKVVF